MGVVVAHGAVDLAQQGHRGNLGDLPLQAVDHVGQFLAEGGRRGRLAMGARQHRHIGELHGQRTNRLGQLTHQRQQHLIAAFAQHQCVGQVVDVLAGAGEMNELVDLGQLRQLLGLLLEQVLHRLDVVVGGALELLDPLGMLQLEVAGQLLEQGGGFGGKGRHLGNAVMGRQALEPADFDLHTAANQTEFTENGTQSAGFAGIAAIDGGNRGERGKLHGRHSRTDEQRKEGADYT